VKRVPLITFYHPSKTAFADRLLTSFLVDRDGGEGEMVYVNLGIGTSDQLL